MAGGEQHPIPARVAELLARVIDDVEQLEILLLLRRWRERYSSPATVAQELMIDASSVTRQLERLGRKNLVDIRIENDVLYRYNPRDKDVEEIIDRLAELYPKRAIVILKVIGTRTSEPARAFADAFAFGNRKKGKE